MPAAYTYKFTGEDEEQQQAQAFLSKAFVVALFLIFLILVSLFNSVVMGNHPFGCQDFHISGRNVTDIGMALEGNQQDIQGTPFPDLLKFLVGGAGTAEKMEGFPFSLEPPAEHLAAGKLLDQGQVSRNFMEVHFIPES